MIQLSGRFGRVPWSTVYTALAIDRLIKSRRPDKKRGSGHWTSSVRLKSKPRVRFRYTTPVLAVSCASVLVAAPDLCRLILLEAFTETSRLIGGKLCAKLHHSCQK